MREDWHEAWTACGGAITGQRAQTNPGGQRAGSWLSEQRLLNPQGRLLLCNAEFRIFNPYLTCIINPYGRQKTEPTILSRLATGLPAEQF